MVDNNDDNLDGIDLNELFNDFNDKPSELLSKSQIKTESTSDDLTENDCTAPRVIRKRAKPKKKSTAKQMTMYDYASSISYKHKQFYSSLDNSITSKTIIKGEKRSLMEDASASMYKKPKTTLGEDIPPDLIDKLLQYLDKRSRILTDDQSSFSN